MPRRRRGASTSTKLTLAAPDGGTRIGWPLRATDVDRMGHVNNAAYWAAVEQRLAEHEPDLRLPHRARLDYRHPIDLGDDVELVETTHAARVSRRVPSARRRQGGRLGRAARLLARSHAPVATLGAWMRGGSRAAHRLRRSVGSSPALPVPRAGRAAENAGAGPAAVASGLVTCVLAPEQTEGPYYVDDAAVRRNVTEGRPGVALALRLTVVDASTCKPVKNAAVEIWHCDASGTYSATGAEADERFLRGVQRTDAKGLALFRPSTPAGTRDAPCTSTRWCISAGTSCTPGSSTFRTS